LWLEVEGRVREPFFARSEKRNTATLRGDDIRIALFFLFFVQVAFFGTGKCVSV
jgi:phosphatidylinositol glycan class N